MKKMTPKQQKVLEYLREEKRKGTEWCTPTEVGEACGKDYAQASSWVASPLRVLVRVGLVERRKGGQYRYVKGLETRD